MENYEQKYKEALEIARKINSGEGVAAPKGWSMLEVIFPELKKSEDDILKELLYNLIVSNDRTPSSKEIFSIYGKTKEDCLAWLEKQGKQKPVEQPKQEWSSKDEDMFTCLWGLLNWAESDPEEYIEWLQSLKQRLNGYR